MGVALERERPVAQVRNDRISDLDVVPREVSFGHAVGGKEHPIRMRQPDRVPADPELVARRHRHRMHGDALRGPMKGPAAVRTESAYGMRTPSKNSWIAPAVSPPEATVSMPEKVSKSS